MTEWKPYFYIEDMGVAFTLKEFEKENEKNTLPSSDIGGEFLKKEGNEWFAESRAFGKGLIDVFSSAPPEGATHIFWYD